MVREDAAQMCALQMQAEAGPSMLGSPESLETAIERFIHKQVLSLVLDEAARHFGTFTV